MLLAGNIFPDYLSGFAQLMASLAGRGTRRRVVLSPMILRESPGSIAITLARGDSHAARPSSGVLFRKTGFATQFAPRQFRLQFLDREKNCSARGTERALRT